MAADCQALEDSGHDAPRQKKSNLVANMGNFSIQYNFTSASIAVQVLTSDIYLGHPLYAQPAWSDNLALAVVFIGSMLGMLVMGRLGDVIGRGRAMRLTTALAAVGAIIPACAMGPPNLTYAILCLGRLVLGIGVGGIYPLSAVHSAEGSGTNAGRGNRVSWAFFWQNPGCLVPYVIAMLLFATLQPDPPTAWVPQLEFRLLFALGCVPAAIVFFASLFEEESADFQLARAAAAAAASPSRGPAAQQPPGFFAALRGEPSETFYTLVGTAGSWFCFDVAFYGTSVFTPQILGDICLSGVRIEGKCNQTLFQMSWQSVVVQGLGIPGCVLAILLIDRMGSKRLNVYGFLLLALNLCAMGCVYAYDSSARIPIFVLYCTLTFLLSFGPNIGTFVLPAVCFPSHIRSTCHGISAFGGKLGAVIGTLLFPTIAGSSVGLPGVLFTQATLCVAGAIISQKCLRHDWHYLPSAVQSATQSFLDGRNSEIDLQHT